MKYNNYYQLIIRILFSSFILGILTFFTPDFSSPILLITTIIILTALDFYIGCFTKLFHFPMLKILIGFVLAFCSLLLIQFLSIGYIFSFISIILGSIIFGLIHYNL